MVERLIELSARHKWIVFGIVLLLTVWAADSVRKTPLDALPDISDPQVIVYIEWMGRSPDLVEDQITYPLVRTLQSTPGVVTVRGYSMFGMSFTYALFDEGTDIYLGPDPSARTAWARAAVTAARRDADPRPRRQRRWLGLSIRVEGRHRTDGPGRAPRLPGLHGASGAAGGGRRRGGRFSRRVPASIPDHPRPRPPRRLRPHARRCHPVRA